VESSPQDFQQVGHLLNFGFLVLTYVSSCSNTILLRCAELSSCAVVDLGNHNLMSSAEFMPSLFKVMHEHGMRLSNHICELLRDVTVIGDPNAGPGQVRCIGVLLSKELVCLPLLFLVV
jgi:hypothetical protein